MLVKVACDIDFFYIYVCCTSPGNVEQMLALFLCYIIGFRTYAWLSLSFSPSVIYVYKMLCRCHVVYINNGRKIYLKIYQYCLIYFHSNFDSEIYTDDKLKETSIDASFWFLIKHFLMHYSNSLMVSLRWFFVTRFCNIAGKLTMRSSY